MSAFTNTKAIADAINLFWDDESGQALIDWVGGMIIFAIISYFVMAYVQPPTNSPLSSNVFWAPTQNEFNSMYYNLETIQNAF